jgi:hypothetical protein
MLISNVKKMMWVIDQEIMLIRNAIPSAACLFFRLKNKAIMGSSINIVRRKLKASTILLLLYLTKTCGFTAHATTMICGVIQIEVMYLCKEELQL